MDMVREAELEDDVETRRLRYENEVKNATTILQLQKIISDRFEKENYKLRVYIDRESGKHFIDTFAAFSLGFLSYNKASEKYDAGMILYEISSDILDILKKVFKGKIEYQYLPVSIKEESKKSYDDNYNDVLKKFEKYNERKLHENKYDFINKSSEDELEEIFKQNDFNEYNSEQGNSFDVIVKK